MGYFPRGAPVLENARHEEALSMVLRAAALVGVIVLVFLVLTWTRAFYGSKENYYMGAAVLAEGSIIRAITFFDRSIRWYTPFNSYVRKSAEKLWESGEAAEREGDEKTALIAFRTIRGGFYSASHLITPGKEWIGKSESKIKGLTSEGQDQKERPEESRSSVDKAAFFKNRQIPPPAVFWTILLEVGLLGWIGSILGLLFFGILPAEKTRKPRVSRAGWLLLGLAFFVLWIIGMIKA